MTNYFGTKYAQLVAYVLIVVMGIVGFTQINHQSSKRVKDRKAQTLALCKVSVVDRDALRNNAIATATLGTTLVNTPPLTNDAETVLRRRRAIAQINTYRDSQLKALPALTCDKNGTVVVKK